MRVYDSRTNCSILSQFRQFACIRYCITIPHPHSSFDQ